MLWWTVREARSKDWGKRLRAVRKLSRVGDPRAAAALVVALRGVQVDVRLTAAECLAPRGDQQAVQVAGSALDDGSERIRLKAARLIATHGQLSTAYACAVVMISVNGADYKRAAQQGAVAVRPLIEEVRRLKAEHKRIAPLASAVRPRTSLDVYVDMEKEVSTRCQAALIALGSVTDPGAVVALGAAVWDDDEKIADEAFRGLNAIGVEKALDIFQAALKHPKHRVRYAAGFYMGKSHSAPVVDALACAWRDSGGRLAERNFQGTGRDGLGA